MPPLTEREFTRQVRDLAQLFGWARYHTWLSKHSSAGFPDEVLVRAPRIVFAELKADAGKVSAAQAEWLDQLAGCPAVEVCLWRPDMIDSIALYLQHQQRPAIGPGWWLTPEQRAIRAVDAGLWSEP